MLAQSGQLFIQRYRIDSYIAEGGMQEVYRASDLSFGREVALKIPKNASAQKRFAKSARVSARIVHPNVAKTLDYFEENGSGYLVEELIDGRDLGKVLRSEYDYFDPHLAAHLFHLIAKGVAASHHAGVIHRDLKPNNIMVGGGPNLSLVKVTDFGIAKMAEQEMAEAAEGREQSMSNSTTAMGALPYMAPEMIEAPKTTGTPADIWALGAILYRLISGQYPFGNGWGAMKNILSGKLPNRPDILGLRPQLEPLGQKLWSIVEDCLQMDAAKRPRADELVNRCGELAYSDAPRRSGTIVSFGDGTGNWGTLSADNGESVFYHLDSYYGLKPVPAVRVNFACFPGEPLPRAFPVLPVKEEPDTAE